MDKIRCIAVFDIGKTNKKLLLFSEAYRLLHEASVVIPETTDDDGFPCEDLTALCCWISQGIESVLNSDKWDLRAINFATYGASWVFVDETNQPLTALYNYLKPFPEEMAQQLLREYGGETLQLSTCSPLLGSLNSGLQLYRIALERPGLFQQIKSALHLPNYLSSIYTHRPATEMTSIGCHTMLWNFEQNSYHSWAEHKGLLQKFPAILPSNSTILSPVLGSEIAIGTGLHDSSAALIPYLLANTEPFVLLSTGTWSICINPFTKKPLTIEELNSDCLNYLSFTGKPVKASRLFLGNEHEKQVNRIVAHFGLSGLSFTEVVPDSGWISDFLLTDLETDSRLSPQQWLGQFSTRSLLGFLSPEMAYHRLIADLVLAQLCSINLIAGSAELQRLFVDGGFAGNRLFMHMLATAMPHTEVKTAVLPQATALGAAMAIHSSWNRLPLAALLNEVIEYKSVIVI